MSSCCILKLIKRSNLYKWRQYSIAASMFLEFFVGQSCGNFHLAIRLWGKKEEKEKKEIHWSLCDCDSTFFNLVVEKNDNTGLWESFDLSKTKASSVSVYVDLKKYVIESYACTHTCMIHTCMMWTEAIPFLHVINCHFEQFFKSRFIFVLQTLLGNSFVFSYPCSGFS